ncbi:MAG: 50S ribosomal protein L13 [uncultured bacterium]|nr:MAG: 50S ribosomal protein L13 [uncultured bacterium]
MKREIRQIDAANKTRGRVATGIAELLMGKDKTSYKPYNDEGAIVEVINIAAMKVDPKKATKTEFLRHTQHPGGLKSSMATDYTPAELLRKAVYNMLPKNSLRRAMLKRLTIK